MCRTPSEIEFRPRISRGVRPPIVEARPSWVFVELERDTVDHHVIDPYVTGAVPCFQNWQQPKMRNGEFLPASMLRLNLTTGFRRGELRRAPDALNRKRQQAFSVGALRVVNHLPGIN